MVSHLTFPLLFLLLKSRPTFTTFPGLKHSRVFNVPEGFSTDTTIIIIAMLKECVHQLPSFAIIVRSSLVVIPASWIRRTANRPKVMYFPLICFSSRTCFISFANRSYVILIINTNLHLRVFVLV